MTKFKGNNNLDTAEKFYQRLSYSHDAFPRGANSLYIKPVRDFYFAERCLYGRVNKNHNPIILNAANLKELPSSNAAQKSLYAIDFVADAFRALVQDFEEAALLGKLDQSDPFLYTLEPHLAYQSVDVMYRNYLSALEKTFFDSFLVPSRNEYILNFRTFLKVFFEFLDTASQSGPITKTAFIASNFSYIRISGLAIWVSDLDPSDDAQKQEFIDSPNFYYYEELSKKHGFYINKQRPWELVADIASTYMLQYANKYGMTSELDILGTYYQRAGGGDLKNLKRLAFRFYSKLVASKKRVSARIEGTKKTVIRSPISFEELETNYPDNFWLDKYADIRYAEQEEPISPGELSALKKDQTVLLGVKGLRYSLTNINDRLSGFANYKGSFASIKLTRQSVLENRNLKPTY